MSGRGKKLSAEDRILWEHVARTATPLPGRKRPEPDAPEPSLATPEATKKAPADQRQDTGSPGEGAGRARSVKQILRTLDKPTTQKIAKGRVPLEASVDLHGLTQHEAHALLLSFLARAHAAGIRHVLVITGKGASLGSDGVLRRAVPSWLATGPFQPLVGGYESAARHHGGAGALYIRLRRAGTER